MRPPVATVYVSLWKYFNALNAAILAGRCDPRRMFTDAHFGVALGTGAFALLAGY